MLPAARTAPASWTDVFPAVNFRFNRIVSIIPALLLAGLVFCDSVSAGYVRASDPSVATMGRWKTEADGSLSTGRGAVTLTLPFKGTGIQVQMFGDTAQEIWWLKQLDNGPLERFRPRLGGNVLYRDLPAGQHTLTLIRDTEGMTGISCVRGFIVIGETVAASGTDISAGSGTGAGPSAATGESGAAVSGIPSDSKAGRSILSAHPGLSGPGTAGSLPTRSRLIEIIGDSVAAGAFYYPEGSYWQRESGYEAFGPRLARKLGARWSCVTASGEGAVRNNGETPPYTAEHAADQLRRTFYTRREFLWDAGQDAPDLIILAYGENDFNDPSNQPDAVYFQTYYGRLVRLVRELNPTAAIFCVTPANAETARLTWPGLFGAVEELRRAGDGRIYAVDLHAGGALLAPEDFLDGVHPLGSGHEKMAEHLYAKVCDWLRW